MEAKYLRPDKYKPMPLPPDFGELSSIYPVPNSNCSTSHSTNGNYGFMHSTAAHNGNLLNPAVNYESGATGVSIMQQQQQQLMQMQLQQRQRNLTNAIVHTEMANESELADQLMRSNKETLNAEALRKASTCLNVVHDQYNNLIPLEFDEAAVLKKIDEQRLARREKIIKSAMKKKT